MDLLSAAVGLGGLGVAALALWLTHRERSAPYRHRLYDTQVQAHVEIGQLLAAHYRGMRREMLADPPDARGIRQATAKEFDAIPVARDKWAAFLPGRTLNALEGYARVCEAIMEPRPDSWPVLACCCGNAGSVARGGAS